jgi:hypothetical protein
VKRLIDHPRWRPLLAPLAEKELDPERLANNLTQLKLRLAVLSVSGLGPTRRAALNGAIRLFSCARNR